MDLKESMYFFLSRKIKTAALKTKTHAAGKIKRWRVFSYRLDFEENAAHLCPTMRYIKENVACTCLQCGKVTYGRADKKFCSEICKNGYHNNEMKESRQARGRVLTALNRNYRILDAALAEGRFSVDLMSLEDKGFRPAYITGCTKVRYGHDVLRCFDICYSQTGSRVFRLRKLSEG